MSVFWNSLLALVAEPGVSFNRHGCFTDDGYKEVAPNVADVVGLADRQWGHPD